MSTSDGAPYPEPLVAVLARTPFSKRDGEAVLVAVERAEILVPLLRRDTMDHGDLRGSKRGASPKVAGDSDVFVDHVAKLSGEFANWIHVFGGVYRDFCQ